MAEACLAVPLASVRAGWEPHVSSRQRADKPEPKMRFRRSADRVALDRVIAGLPIARPLRGEIEESWRRAAARGLRPDTVEPGIEVSFEDGTPLGRAATEVTGTLGEDLAGTNTSVVVADAGGRIIWRCAADRAARNQLDRLNFAPGFVWSEDHVGTNGIGTALHRGIATVVLGDEHFADRLTTSCSAGVPLRLDRDGRLLGLVAIICRAEDANVLMVSVARRAARDIRRVMLAEVATRRDLLSDSFARARRHTRGALAVVSPDLMLMNAAAARVLTSDDRATLWEWAYRAAAANRNATLAVSVRSCDALDASSTPIYDGSEMVGAVIRLPGARNTPAPCGTRSAKSAARFGWSSLTDTELGIAEQVAAGRTNREVAAQLFLSPHTVDSHLRHIYTKLDIASRVQLTRLLVAQGSPSP